MSSTLVVYACSEHTCAVLRLKTYPSKVLNYFPIVDVKELAPDIKHCLRPSCLRSVASTSNNVYGHECLLNFYYFSTM